MSAAAPPGQTEKSSRLLGGIAGNLAVTAVSIAQQILLVPLFLQMWTTEEYATWVVLFSFYSLLAIADFGLHPLSINKYQMSLALPQADALLALSDNVDEIKNAYAVNAFLLLACILVPCFILDPVDVLKLGGSSKGVLLTSIAFVTLAGIAQNLASGCSALYRAHLKVGRLMAIRLAMNIVLIVFQVAVLIGQGSIVWMAAALLLVNSYAVFYMAIFDIPRFVRSRWGSLWPLSFEKYRKTQLEAVPFIVPAAAEPIFNQGPVFVLGLVAQHHTDVVVYNLCRILVSVARMLVQSVCALLGPEVGAKNAMEDDDGVRSNMRIAMTLSASIIGITCGTLAGLGEPVHRVWSQNALNFEPTTLWLMSCALIVTPHTFATISALLYSNQPAIVARFQIARLAALIGLTALMGHRWGAAGGAAAIVISELVTATIPYYKTLRLHFQIPLKKVFEWSVLPMLKYFVIFGGLSLTMPLFADLNTFQGVAIASTLVALCAAGAGYIELQRTIGKN